MDSRIICLLSVLCFVPIAGCSIIFDSSDLMGTRESKEQDDSISGSDAASTTASTNREVDTVKEKSPSDASSDQQNDNRDAGIDVTSADSAAGSAYLDAGIDAGVRDTEGTDGTDGIDTNLDAGIDGGVRVTGGTGGTDTDDNAGKSDAPCAPSNCPDFEWVTIEGGTFMMGSVEGTGTEYEHSQHRVTVQTFEMSKTEVTIAQYSMCVDAGICGEPYTNTEAANWGKSGRENHPINYVSWYQATEFAQWLGGRLPSEAEWEYAARSGGLDYIFPWGNEDATCEHAVIRQDASQIDCGNESTMEVCSKPLDNTVQGLCDMAGNIAEWVEDDYHDSYNGAPLNGQAWIDSPRGEMRILRGGSWYGLSTVCRSAERGRLYPDGSIYGFGFRVVQDTK